MIREINDNNFSNEVLTSNVPVVVDFWAPWCGPCRMLGPVIEEVSNEIGDKVKFVKINVDENPGVSSHFRVSSIPTVMMFKDGNLAETMVGFRPKQDIKNVIEKHI